MYAVCGPLTSHFQHCTGIFLVLTVAKLPEARLRMQIAQRGHRRYVKGKLFGFFERLPWSGLIDRPLPGRSRTVTRIGPRICPDPVLGDTAEIGT